MRDINLKPQPTEITTLIELLNETKIKPTELEITILPDRPKTNDNDDDGNDDDENDSDYYFLKDGKHLGIHAPNVPHLARTFRYEVYSIRSAYLLNRQMMMEQDNQKYKDRNDDDEHDHDPMGKMLPKVDIQNRLWDGTICLLLICPDHATAWSDRKRLLKDKWEEKCVLEYRKQQGKGHYSNDETIVDVDDDDDDDCYDDSCMLNLWQSEIEYLNLLFSQHSKAPNSWSHRKWVSKQMINTIIHNISTSYRTIKKYQSENFDKVLEYISRWAEGEIKICTKIAQEKPKNYYAWTHRRFVIDTIIHNAVEIQKQQHQEQEQLKEGDSVLSLAKYVKFVWNLLESEFYFIHSIWIVQHVSDHSAVHYVGEILRIMIFLGTSSIRTVNDDDDDDRCRISASFINGSFLERFQLRYSGIESIDWKILDDSKKDTTHRWMGELIENILTTSSNDLISNYPSNEVIWVWRRICSQIYLEYLLLVASRQEGTEATQAIYEFVKKEAKYVNDNSSQHKAALKEDEYEQKRYQLYSSTYVLWLLELVRKIWSTDMLHEDMIELERRLTRELSCSSYEQVPSNYWVQFKNI